MNQMEVRDIPVRRRWDQRILETRATRLLFSQRFQFESFVVWNALRFCL